MAQLSESERKELESLRLWKNSRELGALRFHIARSLAKNSFTGQPTKPIINDARPFCKFSYCGCVNQDPVHYEKLQHFPRDAELFKLRMTLGDTNFTRIFKVITAHVKDLQAYDSDFWKHLNQNSEFFIADLMSDALEFAPMTELDIANLAQEESNSSSSSNSTPHSPSRMPPLPAHRPLPSRPNIPCPL